MRTCYHIKPKPVEIWASYVAEIAGRTIAVPSSLSFQNIGQNLQHLIADQAIQDAVRSCGKSNWESVKIAFSSYSEARKSVPVYRHLHDDLTSYLDMNRRPFELKNSRERCRREFQASQSAKGKFRSIDDILRSDLVELLSEIHRNVGAGDGSLRKHPIYTRADSKGNRVQFPSHGDVRELLIKLQDYLQANFLKYPGLSLVVAFVGVVHAHPFADGNGRTARTFFNLLLFSGFASEHFLPISLAASLSDGGFILKLRRAMMGGEWDQLALFFSDALKLSARLQAGGFS